jgi:hypothetical protein
MLTRSIYAQVRRVPINFAGVPNELLDVDSLGQPTRSTEFTIHASMDTRTLITRMDESRRLDLVANLIFRANLVIEETDPQKRSQMKEELQTAIFKGVQECILERKSFMIFSIFNPKLVDSVSPKLRHKDLIFGLLSQPVLRLIMQNRAICVDPNEVLRFTGIVGFKNISEKFLLDMSRLTPRNIDTYFNSFRGIGSVQHDLVRAWFDVWSSGTLATPIVPGSKWTFRRFAAAVIAKQNEGLLREIFDRVDVGMRVELLALCLARDPVTGIPKFPWAVDAIHNWAAEGVGFIEGGEGVGRREEVASLILTPTIALTPDRFAVPESNIFLIDSDVKLTELKSILLDAPTFAITYPLPTVISVATHKGSYIIDLESVERVFVVYLLKQILSSKKVRKIVSSLGSFLRTTGDLVGDTIHFENVVDIRGSRVKRRRISREEKNDSLEKLFAEEGQVCTVLSSKPMPNSDFEQVEHFSGRVPTDVMSREFLGRVIATIPNTHPGIRPLGVALIQGIACDSAVILALEEEFTKRGIVPTEVLDYDPFS